MIKTVEDWNYYELLNLERTASQEEIWQAYQAALSAYHPGSMASYSLITEEERSQIMERIQEAYQTLRDPARRQAYDLALLQHKAYYPPKAPFRKSVGKVEIEEAAPRPSFWQRIRRALFPKKRGEGRRG